MSAATENAEEPVLIVVEETDLDGSYRRRHWEMLAVGIGVITLAFSFRLSGTGSVEAPLGDGLQLPPLCMSRAWFNVECPGCGLTRSFVALAEGDFARSFSFHRIGWLMAAAVAVQVPYRLYELSGPRFPTPDLWKTLFGAALIFALLLNWGLKVCGY